MTLRSHLKRAARKLYSPVAALARRYQASRKEVVDFRREQSRFRADRDRRRKQYEGQRFDFRPYGEVVRALNRDGYAIVRQVIDKGLLLDIRREFETHLDAATCLLPVSKDSARTPGDLDPAQVFLTPEELVRGQGYYRQHTNWAAVEEPLVNCASAVRATFHDLLIDIAYEYLGCIPAVGGINLRKSYANDLGDFDTLYFHCDPNSPKFLKFFFYLNDVDEDGGPFCFVRGSHRKKFKGWRRKYRWTPDEIAAEYGEANLLKLMADMGDLVVADTTGFHRGTKVLSKDRSMLTVNYVIHEEFQGKQGRFTIPREAHESLSEKQRVAADFLEVKL